MWRLHPLQGRQDAAAAPAAAAPRSRKEQPENGPSSYRGVRRHQGRIEARIKVNGKQEHLGSFKSEVEAAKAFDARARQLGRLQSLNFPTADEAATASSRPRMVETAPLESAEADDEIDALVALAVGTPPPPLARPPWQPRPQRAP